MSWGTELWDQYENIAGHTQKGIDFLEKFGQFIRDRCNIEEEYAGKLRRLVKHHQPKKKDEEEHQFTTCKAFMSMMNEINDLAGQHEVISENLTAGIVKEVNHLVKDLKDERKKHLQEGAKVMNNLQQSLAQLDKVKRNYEKAFKESEKSEEAYQKAFADLNLSRAELEKAKNLKTQKIQLNDDCKMEYANQLQKTNNLQSQHYQELMPAIFQHLQEMDEARILRLQRFICQSSEIERDVSPIIHQCLDGIVKASESIEPSLDSSLVIERYKSGFQPPDDIPFEDLSAPKNNGVTNAPVNSIPSIKADSTTVKGTLSAGKVKKRTGIFGIFSSNKNNGCEIKEDYSDLPPNQRRKKLQHKIDSINAQIQQETLARDGLAKMKGVYEQNPNLGDPLSVEGQLNENGMRLDKLRLELHKFQSYLLEAEGKAMTPTPHKRDRNSISDDSLSRSASDSSVSNPVLNNNKISVPGTPIPSHCSSNSPAESGIGTSHTSIPDDSDFDAVDGGDAGEYFDPEPLPVLGTCRALYTFDAQSEGSIPMEEGEELHVIELDQGDGWTRVRRENSDEGFVPSSYIELFLFVNSSSC